MTFYSFYANVEIVTSKKQKINMISQNEQLNEPQDFRNLSTEAGDMALRKSHDEFLKAHEEVLFHTTFAKVAKELVAGYTMTYDGSTGEEYSFEEPDFVVTARDEHGAVQLDSEDKLEDFIRLDVGTQEYNRYKCCGRMIDNLEAVLPQHEISEAVVKSLRAIIDKKIQHIRSERLASQITDDQYFELLRSQRDLGFAIASIAHALDDSNEWKTLDPGDELIEQSLVWRTSGRKGRNSGYYAEYHTCNDEWLPDYIDHSAVLDGLDDLAWPEEFHYPAKLQILINPARRIEFVYTPEILSAKHRHMSHSLVVEQDGSTKEYHNESLSIRIDLDQTAPNGIALDVGRSPHEGERGGRSMKRTGDLLGNVLAKASASGSHEYSGFTAGMASQFTSYAENFVALLKIREGGTQFERYQKKMLAAAALRAVL